MITKENKTGITLKDLREFVEECKNLPEDVIIRIDYSEINTNMVTNIQGDDDNIIFYNW